jgi:hypothetical protein
MTVFQRSQLMLLLLDEVRRTNCRKPARKQLSLMLVITCEL